MTINVKRAYTDAAADDGTRILVDRIWPRGVSKEKAQLDHWFKEVAPSTELRKWFGHDPEKWSEFQKRFYKELDDVPEAVTELREAVNGEKTTLVFAAKDEDHNNAVALKAYLEKNG